ncbi:zinc-finger domain-containing protein [Sporosarcina sp. GW1-11]|uniref:zinc-finger domain-containing protein n=1 Tax=Sporosarcina sp. GW1-11 TaxID=2899126 RepID=UPI00294CC0A1|nr:zinc-finger domain-containing protein [Sporosarcina sp. GW1-11]MDV6378588.1 zinc-finger domain-containing protein [Sporosarcina sp. GW1-11]
MNKVLIMKDINQLLDIYCEGCFVKKQLIKERGKTGAHQFCIAQCTVGEQLQFLGREINKMGTTSR